MLFIFSSGDRTMVNDALVAALGERWNLLPVWIVRDSQPVVQLQDGENRLGFTGREMLTSGTNG